MSNPVEADRFNKDLKSCLVETEDGFALQTCLFCNRFFKSREKARMTIEELEGCYDLFKIKEDDIWMQQTKKFYTFSPPQDRQESTIPWEKLFLSRKGYYECNEGADSDAVLCCILCYAAARKRIVPPFSIVNSFYFGEAPSCLTDLTPVELAMISPVKYFGYIFTYSGGFHKELKGTLTFYRKKMESTARSVLNLEYIGLGKEIVVLIDGKMTKEQQRKAKAKSQIRVEKVLTALKWLLQNNKLWYESGLTAEGILENMSKPILVDNHKLETWQEEPRQEEEASNVESKEVFEVFFPDPTLAGPTFGQESPADFHSLVERARKEGYDIKYRTALGMDCCRELADNNFVHANLLQFPYGIGGPEDERMTGGKKKMMSVKDYTQCLTYQNSGVFQGELMCLMLYNMQIKNELVVNASYRVRVRGDIFRRQLANDLSSEALLRVSGVEQNDVDEESLAVAREYLGIIDSVSQDLPHGNERSKRARKDIECLTHHFGVPAWFLTITPDDNNSVLVQIFQNKHFVPGVEELSMEQILKQCHLRSQERLECPGFCAFAFDVILDAICRELLGWNMHSREFEEESVVGRIDALTFAVEEQGRKTLHVHFLIFQSETSEFVRRLHELPIEATESKHYKSKLSELQEHCSVSMFKRSRDIEAHECKGGVKRRRCLDDPDLQVLRNMRTTASVNCFKCNDCEKEWKLDEVLLKYVNSTLSEAFDGIRDLESFESMNDVSTFFKHRCYENQCRFLPSPPIEVNLAYNHHRHSSSCFKKCNECRYRFPAVYSKRCQLVNLGSEAKWFRWTGSSFSRHEKELLLKRTALEICQNNSFGFLNKTILACNSNLMPILESKIGCYCAKYVGKSIQEDDRVNYVAAMERVSKTLKGLRKHDIDNKEAVRRVLVGAFAQQKSDIVGSQMASFLTRHHRRFFFSHDFAFCPLTDILKIYHDKEAGLKGHSYFVSQAMNYICRPDDLDEVCPFDFYSKYVVVKNSNPEHLLQFSHEREDLKHPSWKPESQCFAKAVRSREQEVLCKISQFVFPDAADLGGNMLASDFISSQTSEELSKLVLCLFTSHRYQSDMQISGSFTKKLIDCLRNNRFSKDKLQFLQNIQDSTHNVARSQRKDFLYYETENPDIGSQEQDDEGNEYWVPEDEPDDQEEPMEICFDWLKKSRDAQRTASRIPPTFDFARIRKKGSHDAGFKLLAKQPPTTQSTMGFVVQNESLEPRPLLEDDNQGNREILKDKVNKRDLVSLYIERVQTRERISDVITKEKMDVAVDGTAESIRECGFICGLDQGQMTAYMVITANFVLEVYKDAENAENGGRNSIMFTLGGSQQTKNVRHTFAKHKTAVSTMSLHGTRRNQMIALLHGPGGSGKSQVINTVIAYCRSLCSKLKLRYDSSTIMVTALSGVAATLIKGFTVHSKALLNQRKPITYEQVQEWSGCKMLIVDEISFASADLIVKLEKNLRILKGNPFSDYGGLSIVFCGDFRQLEPPGGTALYDADCPIFHDLINTYFELNGQHRFKEDPKWGAILGKMRDGSITAEDIDVINRRAVYKDLPEGIHYATFMNRDRDAINSGLFERRLEDTTTKDDVSSDSCLVLMSSLEYLDTNRSCHSVGNEAFFWSNYAEDDLCGRKRAPRVDSVLKLFQDCKVMLPENDNVECGRANGTTARVKSIHVRDGAQEVYVTVRDRKVRAALAEDVTAVKLQHDDVSIKPREFELQPKQHSFLLKDKTAGTVSSLSMRGVQLPVISNGATTGHKLQGCTVKEIFVHNWEYQKNWAYVVLSRVKTMNGLYMRCALDRDVSKYSVPQGYENMIENFRHVEVLYNDIE